MLRRPVLLAIVAMLLAGAAYYFLFHSIEDKVKKQLRLLAEYVSKDPGEKNLVMLFKTQNLPSLFAEQCDLEIAGSQLSGSYTPEEIMSHVVRGRMQFSKLSLNFYDIAVEYPGKTTARAEMTAKLAGTVDKNKAVEEVREIQAELKLVDGKWLFSKFKVVEVLEK